MPVRKMMRLDRNLFREKKKEMIEQKYEILALKDNSRFLHYLIVAVPKKKIIINRLER